MPAIKENELAKFIGYLYVASKDSPTTWKRIASVRNLIANYDPTANQVEVNADDTGTVFQGTTPEARITATFLETFNFDLLPIFFGATVTDTPSSSSTDDQVIAGGSWEDMVFIALTGQNSDGSKPTINSVSGSTTGALAEDDDYYITKNTEGEWGITINTAGSAGVGLTEDITVNTTYTPSASKSTELSGSTIELPSFAAKIVATDPNDPTKERTIHIDDCVLDSAYAWDFLDVVEAGDMNGSDINIKGNKGCTLTITDEILS